MLSLLEQFIRNIPIVTRAILSMILLTTLAVELNLVTPYKLYLDPKLIVKHGQVWRLLTCCTYFGRLNMSFICHFLYTYKTIRDIEESIFEGKVADFVYMLIFGWISMCILGTMTKMMFLQTSVNSMLLYVFCMKYGFLNAELFGFIQLRLRDCPLVMLLVSLIAQDDVAPELIGMLVGRVYYYLTDVYPSLHGGYNILETPWFIRRLFESTDDDTQLTDGGGNDGNRPYVNLRWADEMIPP